MHVSRFMSQSHQQQLFTGPWHYDSNRARLCSVHHYLFLHHVCRSCPSITCTFHTRRCPCKHALASLVCQLCRCDRHIMCLYRATGKWLLSVVISLIHNPYTRMENCVSRAFNQRPANATEIAGPWMHCADENIELHLTTYFFTVFFVSFFFCFAGMKSTNELWTTYKWTPLRMNGHIQQACKHNGWRWVPKEPI